MPITLLLPASVGQKVFFDEQPRLEKAWILGIEAFSFDQVQLDQQSRQVLDAADCSIPLVTFKVGAEETIFETPYSKLIAELNAGAVPQFAALPITWSKSYVEIPTGSTFTDTLPRVLYFLVHYIPVDRLSDFTPEELRQFKL